MDEKWEPFITWTGFAVAQWPLRYCLPGGDGLVTAGKARRWYEKNKELYEYHSGGSVQTFFCKACGCACQPVRHKCHVRGEQ